MTDSISDLLHRARTTPPSSLNDAMRTIDLLADALERCSADSSDAIKMERERCAAICDEWVKRFGKGSIEYVPATEYATDAVCDIADLIRKGTPLPTDHQPSEAK